MTVVPKDGEMCYCGKRDALIPCTYKVEAPAAGAAICFIDDFFDAI